jgi:glucose/arabinose dehydrogenase
MPRLRRWTRIAAALALLGAAGCPGGGGGGGDMPPGPPQVQLSVERVFPALTFSAPVAMLQAPNDTSRWFVVEQGGVVRVFQNAPAVAATTTPDFIDISGQVTFSGEAGLLGMAFHPNFPADQRVYLFYSQTASGNLMSLLAEFQTKDGGLTLDPSSKKILITLPKPNNEGNHNGGNLAFGPDGFLYAGIGDGGGGNDSTHGPIGNAQNPNTLFGKMLRIQITAASGSYGIPPDNPNAGNPLCNLNGTGAQPCPEIFALGMRNPWRWSFDRATGQLWVGDVGQNAIEEVDRVDLGGNYGWRCFEGTRSNTDVSCGVPGPFIPPVAQYGRSVGVTVTGGYVYRGTRFQGLVGRYIFADFGVGTIFSIDSTAQGTLNVTDGFMSALSISSFGQGIDGELFVVDYGGGGLYHIRQ